MASGHLSPVHVRDCDRYSDGIQLSVNVDGEIPVSTAWEGSRWHEVKFNLTPGEVRQLAAHLIAAADSHGGIDQSHHTRLLLEKSCPATSTWMFGVARHRPGNPYSSLWAAFSLSLVDAA